MVTHPIFTKTWNRKRNYIAVGMCLQGSCICLPNPESTDVCTKFQWDRSSLVTSIMGLQILTWLMFFRTSWYGLPKEIQY
eukprot:UN16229